MSTIAPASSHTSALPWLADHRNAAGPVWRKSWIAGGLALAFGALLLRVWGITATMGTSDQATMAWMVRHRFGIKWLFAHQYGPVLTVVQRTWAELLYRLRLPMGEASVRTPVMLASLVQIPLTFALLRRIGCGRGESALGALICVLLPVLVTDAHYGWGYATFWLLTGTMALWATLAYFDEQRPRWLALAGLSLMAHCLSNCFAFALPITILVAWWMQLQTQSAKIEVDSPHRSGQAGNSRRTLMYAWLVGFFLPCVAALMIIGASYLWTGGGQLGHLFAKQRVGTLGVPIAQLVCLPQMWSLQFGYLFGVPAFIGLIYATCSGGRCGLLACWCWASLLPMVLLVNWERVGAPSCYMIETGLTGGVLGAIVIYRLYQRLGHRPVARASLACAAVLVIGHMAVGSADACLQDGSLARYTGIETGWGSIKAETGIKAAGWYVRQHVPTSAIIMTTHTNKGMEVPVAEYYSGRSVLASFDLKPAFVEPLVRTMAPRVDVLIVEAERASLADSLTGFTRVATFRRNGVPVRYTYARTEMNLPSVDGEAAIFNQLYNREHVNPRVPLPLITPPRFEKCLGQYQDTVRELRAGTITACAATPVTPHGP